MSNIILQNISKTFKNNIATMMLSKKEISILIEIIFSISFAFIFMPYFYENRLNSYDFDFIAMKITNCRSCKSKSLTNLYTLGKQTLTGIFPSKKKSKEEMNYIEMPLPI